MIAALITWYLYISVGFMAYDVATNKEVYDQKKDFTGEMVKMVNRGLLWPKTIVKWLKSKIFSA